MAFLEDIEVYQWAHEISVAKTRRRQSTVSSVCRGLHTMVLRGIPAGCMRVISGVRMSHPTSVPRVPM
jgi:hypothetical protein